jgi:hypothetical protein
MRGHNVRATTNFAALSSQHGRRKYIPLSISTPRARMKLFIRRCQNPFSGSAVFYYYVDYIMYEPRLIT